MILGARGQFCSTGTQTISNLDCLHYRGDVVGLFFCCLYSFFNSLPQHALCQISHKKNSAHTYTHTYTHTPHTNTWTKEPSADSSVDIEKQPSAWCLGFYSVTLAELFVWLRSEKSSVSLLKLFMVLNGFQSSPLSPHALFTHQLQVNTSIGTTEM